MRRKIGRNFVYSYLSILKNFENLQVATRIAACYGRGEEAVWGHGMSALQKEGLEPTGWDHKRRMRRGQPPKLGSPEGETGIITGVGSPGLALCNLPCAVHSRPFFRTAEWSFWERAIPSMSSGAPCPPPSIIFPRHIMISTILCPFNCFPVPWSNINKSDNIRIIRLEVDCTLGEKW